MKIEMWEKNRKHCPVYRENKVFQFCTLQGYPGRKCMPGNCIILFWDRIKEQEKLDLPMGRL